MRPSRRVTLAAPPPDPFGERRRLPFHAQMRLLGAPFEFETNSSELLRLIHQAYQGLPAHRFTDSRRRLRISLILAPRSRLSQRSRKEPQLVQPLAGGEILCGAVAGGSFAAMTPQQRSALIVVAHELLRFRHHVRYELLEFTVYVLAARAQRLLPLHAGCIGHAGQGALLLGASGSGKSTLVLHGLLSGLDFLAEDSVLVKPQSLQATGVANFVHVRPNSLRFLTPAARHSLLQRSAPILRRSGVQKLEIDLRGAGYRLAPAPLRIRAVVFLSSRSTGGSRGSLLTSLSTETMLRRLAASQRYAAQQPGWSRFCARLAPLPAYELRRGAHPLAGVTALRELLA